jgi:hypothetical protein
MPVTRLGSVFFLIALLLCGCGGDGRMKPRGRIVKSGAPLQLPEDEGIRIAFLPVEATGKTYDSYLAQLNKDGTFQVIGKDGKGLPPGKYRVSMEHLKNKKDLFKGAFFGSKSPIVCDVKNASDEIVIDLDNPSS